MPESTWRYTNLEPIGRGAQAVVYAARDSVLGRSVALKVLRGAAAGSGAAERLAREARLIGKLQHENIVEVYDGGENEGRPYVAMELVEGGTLAGRISTGPLPPRDAARIVHRLAGAVAAAHAAGILHRDIKPSNVLLSKEGEPKLSDFGFARDVQEHMALTFTGEIVGSPAYLAPEVARRGARSASAASDVYALGALLYEMLTGRPPFEAPTLPGVLALIEGTHPMPPRALLADIPPDLEAVCLRSMAKSPGARYTSAGELAADCQRFLDGSPVAARPPSLFSRTLEAAFASKLLLASSVISAAAFVAALIWSTSSIRVAEEELRAAIQQREQTKQRCDGLRQRMRDTEEELDQLRAEIDSLLGGAQ